MTEPHHNNCKCCFSHHHCTALSLTHTGPPDAHRMTVGITSLAKNTLSMANAWEESRPNTERTNTSPPRRSDEGREKKTVRKKESRKETRVRFRR